MRSQLILSPINWCRAASILSFFVAAGCSVDAPSFTTSTSFTDAGPTQRADDEQTADSDDPSDFTDASQEDASQEDASPVETNAAEAGTADDTELDAATDTNTASDGEAGTDPPDASSDPNPSTENNSDDPDAGDPIDTGDGSDGTEPDPTSDAGDDIDPIPTDAGDESPPDAGSSDCEPDETQSCYELDGVPISGGLVDDEPVGNCAFGTQTCDADGQWGPCEGAIGPSTEPDDCDTPLDDADCNGDPNENCTCFVGEDRECEGGLQLCETGGAWGACQCSDGYFQEGSECKSCEVDCVSTCGDFGDCETVGDSLCDQTGIQVQACVDRVCEAGACVETLRPEVDECELETDGLPCAEDDCETSCVVTSDNECAQLGQQTETCTTFACSNGLCVESQTITTGEACPSPTDGNACDDGLNCTENDACSGGTCVGSEIQCADDGLFCTGPETCVETTGCTHLAGPCEDGQTCFETRNFCAVSCTGDRSITTQAELDAFIAEGCGVLEGNLTVDGGDWTGSTSVSLAGLESLREIDGDLRLRNFQVEDVVFSTEGLEGLELLTGNLTLDGIDVTLTGLTSLATIDGRITVGFDGVVNLDGLQNLTSLGGLSVVDNNNVNLDALTGLTRIEGALVLELVTLASLTGLQNLTSVGSIFIFDVGGDLDDLENLTTIDGNLSIALSSLDLSGLSNVTTVGGNLRLTEELSSDITPLQGIQSIGGDLFIDQTRLTTLSPFLSWPEDVLAGELTITDNDNLATCEVTNLSDHLNRPACTCSGNTGTGDCE